VLVVLVVGGVIRSGDRVDAERRAGRFVEPRAVGAQRERIRDPQLSGVRIAEQEGLPKSVLLVLVVVALYPWLLWP
jgi:hypothetical protein